MHCTWERSVNMPYLSKRNCAHTLTQRVFHKYAKKKKKSVHYNAVCIKIKNKKQKQPRSSSVKVWLNKQCYIHIMEYQANIFSVKYIYIYIYITHMQWEGKHPKLYLSENGNFHHQQRRYTERLLSGTYAVSIMTLFNPQIIPWHKVSFYKKKEIHLSIF